MDSKTVCPELFCTAEITRRKRIAAPTSAPGEEDDMDALEELSIDEKIIRLEMSAKRGIVTSFRSDAYYAVSPLCGMNGE